jgi:hypothetical protein
LLPSFFPRKRRKKRTKLILFLSFSFVSAFLFFLFQEGRNKVSQNTINEKHKDKEIKNNVEEEQKSEKK